MWLEFAQNGLYNIFFFPLSIGFLHYSLFPAFFDSASDNNSLFFNKNTYLIV